MNSLVGKKLLVLGGDLLSQDIVLKAQSMGIYVIVTDWYDTSRSPAKLVADEYWDVSIQDYDELSRRIQEEHVCGVLTGFTDSYLIPYQILCEKNNLPCYGTREQFEIFTDKEKYKALCRRHSVPIIEGYAPDDSRMAFPVLIKPVDGSGSRGIRICHDCAEFDRILSQYDSRVIIERYMTGREVTVFWLFIDGEYRLMAIGNRHVKQSQTGNIIPLPVGYTFPASVTLKYRQEVEACAKEMFSEVGIRNGMMFMQCKVEDDICRVYDIGFRLTGSLEYKLFERVYGINPLAMLIRFALTGTMLDDEPIDRVQPEYMSPCFNVSCLCAPGTICDLTGMDQVRAFPEVIDVMPAHMPGFTVSEHMKGLLAQITIRVLGAVTDKDELLPVMQKIHDSLDIVSDSGQSLLLPGIDALDLKGVIL